MTGQIVAERVVGYDIDVMAAGGPVGDTEFTWRIPFYLSHRPDGADEDKRWAVCVRQGPPFPLTDALRLIPFTSSTLFAGTLDDARALAVEFAEVIAPALSAGKEAEQGDDRLGRTRSAVGEFVTSRE